jgi:phage tail-like protein
MAIKRDRPFGRFNFLVDLGDGNSDGPEAGFQECSPISMEVQVADVTLKRGIIGSLGLYGWLDQIRNGDEKALRTVTIRLQSEDHAETVLTWKLLRARIVKYSAGPLDARGGDVAMEELTLAYERLEIE